MITRQKQLFYFVGNQPFASLEEAQKVDLVGIMAGQNWTDAVRQETAEFMIKNASLIVDTLTTTPRSRLRARKSHGATRKPKTPKPAPSNGRGL